LGSELKSTLSGGAAALSVGERVTLDDPNTEYVVIDVDHATGRVELLRLKPGRIESDIPVASVRKRSETGPYLVTEKED
jgi:hypothetical protein